MFKKSFLAGFIAFSFVLSPIFASADTVSDIQAQINAILAQIKVLQAQLNAQTGVSNSSNTSAVSTSGVPAATSGVFCHAWNRSLRIGDQNDDVTNLVRALIKENLLSADEMFQDGRTVLNFDERVASAVVAFQEKYAADILKPNNLSHGTGFVGVSTRAKLNRLYGCGRTIQITEPTKEPSLTVLSPNGGESWQKGTTQTIKWQDNRPVQACTIDSTTGIGACSTPRLYDLKLAPYYPPCTGQICPTYAYREPYFIAKGVSGSSYNWGVGKVISTYGSGETAPDGAYTVQVCHAGTSTCDSSDSYFKITSQGSNLPPVVDGISGPTVLRVGESGTWSLKAHDPENSSLSYTVDWGDRAFGEGVGSLPSPTVAIQQNTSFVHSYAVAGTYTVKFTLTDNAGLTVQSSISVQVGFPEPPQVTTVSVSPGNDYYFKGYITLKHLSDGGFMESPTAGNRVDELLFLDGMPPADNASATAVYYYWQGAWRKVGLGATVIDSNTNTSTYFVVRRNSGLTGTLAVPASVTTYFGSTIINGTTRPWSSTEPSLTVLSPNGGESYILGKDSISIRWSPALPGVSTIQIVSSKGEAFQLYGQKVSGDPTNVNGYYTYQLPNNLSTIYPDTFYENLGPPNGKQGGNRTKSSVLSPPSPVPPSNSKNSIAGVVGQQQTYTPGAIISFSVKGIEPDGTPASQQKGFNVQAHLYNQNVGMNPSFQAVNGIYNTSSGYWDVKLTAPSDVTIPYEVKIGLYCGYVGFDSVCAQKYGTNSEQYSTFQFRVTNAEPSLTVLSPNGGESWQIGTTQTIKWQTNTADFDYYNISLENTASDGIGIQLGTNISKTLTNFTFVLTEGIVNGVVANSGGKTLDQVKNGFYIHIMPMKVGINGAGYNFDAKSSTFTITAPTSSNQPPTITPGRITINSGQPVTLNFANPSGVLDTAKLYLYCPSGITSSAGSSGIDRCNSWYTFPMLPSSGEFTFFNNTNEVKKVVPNYYIYYPSNPSHAVGGSSEITVNPAVIAQPSITVLSPNGGESFMKGQVAKITWRHSGILPFYGTEDSDTFTIRARPNNSNTAYFILANLVKKTISEGQQSYDWYVGSTIANLAGNDLPDGSYTLEICQSFAFTTCDRSDRQFLVSPVDNSGDLIISDFTWAPLNPTVSATDSYVTFSLTVQNIGTGLVFPPGGAKFSIVNESGSTVGAILTGSGSYILAPQEKKVFTFSSVQTPNIRAIAGTFKITAMADSTGVIPESREDNNTLTKTITIGTTEPSLTVLSPNGGESWQIGTTQAVKWNSNLVSIPEKPITYDISLVPYCPAGQICVALAPFVIAKGVYGLVYDWKVGSAVSGSAPAGSYTVQVCQSGTTTCDGSDSYFKIIAAPMTDAEVIKKLEEAIRMYTCSSFNSAGCNSNFDLNSDGQVAAADELKMRSVLTQSDAQFDVIYKKIEAEFRARAGASKGTSLYLEAFDPNRSDSINTADWSLISKAMIGTRVYVPKPVLTDAEIITNLEKVVRNFAASTLSFKPEIHANFDLNDDKKVNATDEILIRNILTLSDGQFDIAYKKIMAAVEARMGLKTGDTNFLSEFDINQSGVMSNSERK